MTKPIYKLSLVMIKAIPMCIAFVYLLNSLLSYFDIDVSILSTIGGMSILTLILMYCLSIAFEFCAYHRMFLHYILIEDVINYIDYYTNGTLCTDRELFVLHSIVVCIVLFLILILRFKCKRNERKQ